MTDAILNRSHAALAAVSAVLLVASAAATGIAGIIMAFGGHVSAIDVSAKATLAGATVALLSKGIDSVNDAWRSRGATSPGPSAAPPASDPTTATIQALGRALAGFGSPPPIA